MDRNLNIKESTKDYKLLANSNVEQFNENIISLTLFGSYSTEFWNENRSDIDILVLVKYYDFDIELKIEDYYRETLADYFGYDNIHFTFIYLNDFDKVFADIYIDFSDKMIFDMELHYDFLMYISKYNRVNENLINLVRKDWEAKYGVL